MYAITGEDFDAIPLKGSLGPGLYDVFIEDGKGCIWERLGVLVSSPDSLSVDAGPDQEIDFGDSTQVNAVVQNPVSGFKLLWQSQFLTPISCDTCRSTMVKPEETMQYQVSIVDGNGCRAEDDVWVFVVSEREIYIPTGFSPNGDGQNDRLLFHGNDDIIIKSFQIYDRWGEQIYFTENASMNDPAQGWDGTYKGIASPAGVYVWSAEVQYKDGTFKNFKGHTTLIR